MQRNTDFILLQFSLAAASVPALAAAGARYCAQCPLPASLERLVWSRPTQTAYLYARLPERTLLDAHALPPLAAAWAKACAQAGDIKVSRLEKMFAIEGHSSVEAAPFHYVVEMDPEAGWMPEIARWYDTEHMPGLAGVPGCVHAMRLRNHDHGPLSLACYDLVTAQTLGSPAWLAVRGTAWSDIARPHFTNTKRTMFEVLA